MNPKRPKDGRKLGTNKKIGAEGMRRDARLG
jgi:hypothetical protein